MQVYVWPVERQIGAGSLATRPSNEAITIDNGVKEKELVEEVQESTTRRTKKTGKRTEGRGKISNRRQAQTFGFLACQIPARWDMFPQIGHLALLNGTQYNSTNLHMGEYPSRSSSPSPPPRDTVSEGLLFCAHMCSRSNPPPPRRVGIRLGTWMGRSQP